MTDDFYLLSLSPSRELLELSLGESSLLKWKDYLLAGKFDLFKLAKLSFISSSCIEIFKFLFLPK